MFQLFKQFDLEIRCFILKFQKLFLIELLKMVTLSCTFSEFVGMFFHNVGPLVEILYLVLPNLNGVILYLDVEKFVGYL